MQKRIDENLDKFVVDGLPRQLTQVQRSDEQLHGYLGIDAGTQFAAFYGPLGHDTGGVVAGLYSLRAIGRERGVVSAAASVRNTVSPTGVAR